jgi:hypothetical protein
MDGRHLTGPQMPTLDGTAEQGGCGDKSLFATRPCRLSDLFCEPGGALLSAWREGSSYKRTGYLVEVAR